MASDFLKPVYAALKQGRDKDADFELLHCVLDYPLRDLLLNDNRFRPLWLSGVSARKVVPLIEQILSEQRN